MNATIYKDLKIKNSVLKIKDIEIFKIDFKDDEYYNNQIINDLKAQVKLNSSKVALNLLFDNIDRFTKIVKDNGDVDFVYSYKSYHFVNLGKCIHISMLG